MDVQPSAVAIATISGDVVALLAATADELLRRASAEADAKCREALAPKSDLQGK